MTEGNPQREDATSRFPNLEGRIARAKKGMHDPGYAREVVKVCAGIEVRSFVSRVSDHCEWAFAELDLVMQRADFGERDARLVCEGPVTLAAEAYRIERCLSRYSDSRDKEARNCRATATDALEGIFEGLVSPSYRPHPEDSTEAAPAGVAAMSSRQATAVDVFRTLTPEEVFGACREPAGHDESILARLEHADVKVREMILEEVDQSESDEYETYWPDEDPEADRVSMLAEERYHDLMRSRYADLGGRRSRYGRNDRSPSKPRSEVNRQMFYLLVEPLAGLHAAGLVDASTATRESLTELERRLAEAKAKGSRGSRSHAWR